MWLTYNYINHCHMRAKVCSMHYLLFSTFCQYRFAEKHVTLSFLFRSFLHNSIDSGMGEQLSVKVSWYQFS